jgi:hypothetical protein
MNDCHFGEILKAPGFMPGVIMRIDSAGAHGVCLFVGADGIRQLVYIFALLFLIFDLSTSPKGATGFFFAAWRLCVMRCVQIENRKLKMMKILVA